MSNTKIILGIQYLRGLAALGVVICHYGMGLQGHPMLMKGILFGQYGVQVFFLISGFVIVYSLTQSAYKPQQFFKFLLKRSIRIDPAYIITILLTILLFKILSFIPSFKGNSIDFIPGQFLAHIFYIVPFTKYSFYDHVFWTLGIEFQFYLLVGILYFLSSSKMYKTGFVILFSLTSLIPFANSHYLVFIYAPIFALGIAFISFYRNTNWLNAILPLFLLIFIGYKFDISICLLLLICLLVIFFIKIYIKPLFLLGNISYSLYLIHGLVFILVSGILKKLHFDLAQNQLIWLFIKIIFALIAASLFHLIIEKPSLQLSKRIFYKKQV